MSNICAYCKKENCKCGAEDYDLLQEKDIENTKPFFYNGYIVYALDYQEWDSFYYVFYLGTTLIDKIMVSKDEVSELRNRGENGMAIVWPMFEQRRKDVDLVKGQHDRT